jgi:signal transduction histidine kinase
LFVAAVVGIPLVPAVAGLIAAFDAIPSAEIKTIEAASREATAALRRAYGGRAETEAGRSEPELEAGIRAIERIRATATRFTVFERETRAALWGAGAVSAALAIGLGFSLWLLTSRRFLVPLGRLAEGIERVRDGASGVRLECRGHPQMRYVLDSFNAMVTTLEEQAAQIRSFERQSMTRFLIHQFRNSITPIALSNQNIRHVTADPQEASSQQQRVLREATEMIDAQTRRMQRLIDEFASLTRFPEPTPTVTELNTFCESVARNTTRSRSTHTLRVETADHRVEAPIDATLMEHALNNLIENALDALGDRDEAADAEVVVAVRPGPRIVVADTGKGMDPETAEQVFDEHFTTKRRGMGIGLSFAKRVAEAHGFAIRLESIPGQGTTVTIDMSENSA